MQTTNVENCKKEQKGRSSASTTAMKDDRALFARFLVVITSRPEIDLKESIGELEFAVYPRSLFTLDGSVRYCSGKSKLMEILENLPKGELADADKEHDETSVVIIDGMAVAQAMGKLSWVKTIQDLSNHFVQVVERRSAGFKEVHVVFDRYDIQHSLKQGTRTMRQGGYSISNESVIEKVSLQQLLSNADKKQKLAMHLSSHLIQCHEQSETIYVTTYNDECKSNALSVEYLQSTHEEAYTMMMLHVMDATNRGATSICIQSPDTDVLVLALWCFPDMGDDTTMIVGTGNARRVISVCQIHSALDEEQVSALPGLHALSGCDQTGTFCGKSKLSWWNSIRKCDDKMLAALCNIGSDTELRDDDINEIERFICQLYVPGTEMTTMKDMRWLLFSKRQYTDEKLPPTKAALIQTVKRANYMTLVWKRCGIPCPDLPDPTGHGWHQDDDILLPVTTTLLPAPKDVLHLVRCDWKTNCITMNISCRKHNLKCTDSCISCEESCDNRNVVIDHSVDENDDTLLYI